MLLEIVSVPLTVSTPHVSTARTSATAVISGSHRPMARACVYSIMVSLTLNVCFCTSNSNNVLLYSKIVMKFKASP